MTGDGHRLTAPPVHQIRIARPTDRLDEVVAFYRDGLGLQTIGDFRGHDGYDGVILKLPGKGLHLEFTCHARGSPCPSPSKDNLLVFYLCDPSAASQARDRLATMGCLPVASENPYWAANGVTFEDPDGWRVVLYHGRPMRTAGRLADD